MTLKHQNLCLENSLIAQRKVNSHLVTIEVSVEGCTCQWVQLNSLTFDHLRLESLNTKTVKSRSTVEHNRMTLHHILENIPDYWLTTINNLLGALYSLHNTTFYELADNEWLIKLGSHQLRKTAFTHLQLRTYNDYSLLQHTLLITEDYLRSLDFHQSLQTVVTNYNTTIEVIEI